MRWERLFDDLEAMLVAQEESDVLAEVAERTRAERATIGLIERFLASQDAEVAVRLATGLTVRGVVRDVGSAWVLLRTGPERGALVPFAAIRAITGLQGRVAPAGAVAKAFGIGAALRAVSRDRAAVTLLDTDGQRTPGTIDAVGSDWLELAEHPLDVPRRAAGVISVRVVPIAAIAAILRD